jgi:cytochrome c oxidase subunit 2
MIALVAVAGRSVFDPAGPAARELAGLGWPILVFFAAVSLAVWCLLAWVALRRRGSLDRHERASAGGGEGWIVIGGLVIPAIAFTVVFIMTLDSLAAFPMADGAGGRADIRVKGRQWWWEVEYLMEGAAGEAITANEIHIPAGEPVTVELVSADVIHSFWVPRLHGKVDLLPGRANRITLEADAPGTYAGACAEFCGLQHAHMQFRVIAEPPEDFRRWLTLQRQPATAPVTTQEHAGREAFMNGPCLVCHSVRGTRARGTVGPDLTHVAGRRMLGAGASPNNPAAMHAWIRNAQAIKPGIVMPRMRAVMTDEELQNVVAWLRTLK